MRRYYSLGLLLLTLAAAEVNADTFSTVVIDPGHGGFDRGGISGQRVAEKEVALDTALRLEKILRAAGLRTVMTRRTDIFIPLPMRTAIANAQHEAVFVSIHYNSARRSAAHGIETYCEDSAGAPLAARIQRDIISQVSAEDRGVKHAEYYVLRNCNIPAVLVECGFLTNPYEAHLAETAAYRQRVAQQIADGILEQRHYPLPKPSPAPRRSIYAHHGKKHKHRHYLPA